MLLLNEVIEIEAEGVGCPEAREVLLSAIYEGVCGCLPVGLNPSSVPGDEEHAGPPCSEGEHMTCTGASNVAERFFARVHRDGPLPLEAVEAGEVTGNCWNFLGGYGFGIGNSSPKQPHRVSWMLHNGPIPPELTDVDHLCNNHTCVNPDHLEPVTHSANIKRGVDRTKRLDARRAAWWMQVMAGEAPTAVHTSDGVVFTTPRRGYPPEHTPVETVELSLPRFGAQWFAVQVEVSFLRALEHRFAPHAAWVNREIHRESAAHMAAVKVRHATDSVLWKHRQVDLVTIEGTRCFVGLLYGPDGPYALVCPYPGTLH